MATDAAYDTNNSLKVWQCANDNRSWYKRCSYTVSYDFLWIRKTRALVEYSLVHAVW